MVNQVNDGYMQIELYLAGSMAKKKLLNYLKKTVKLTINYFHQK